ncbi:MAG: glycoside hydrolase family 43 protein [Chitinispirillaceae bacterium]|nr:glycoside hydrolase family 43 protein [Chitinispirillaceae bacterium]
MKNSTSFYFILFLLLSFDLNAQQAQYSGNPLFKGLFTADPCALVYKDTLYVFTGHDEQTQSGKSFLMRDWYIFSSADMVKWTNHGTRLKAGDFSWASGNAFAGHVVEHNGKFWWYVSVTHKSIKVGEGFSIGVAVADHPLGPYKDVGHPLITDKTANSVTLNIDPAVYIDNGTPWLFWGSWGAARMVKLKNSMTELDGSVETVNAKDFFEAPWIHKRDKLYYLSYASGYPSTTKYCTGSSIRGPWTYKGIINDLLENSETNHQAILQFKGNWYFIYHNGGLPGGGTYRRSVCIDKLEYNSDGTIKKVIRTTTGVPAIPIVDIPERSSFKNGIKNFERSSKQTMVIAANPERNCNAFQGTSIFTPSGVKLTKKLTSASGIYIQVIRKISENGTFTGQ